MRRCPICDTELAFVDYEGFQIHQCATCRGHLLPSRRLETIKRLPEKSSDELKDEVRAEFGASTAHRLRCPKCRRLMTKHRINVAGLELHTDECGRCDLVWLDGGELALLQLAHQASAAFLNQQEIRRRMEELEASPERKARFEEQLAKLPEEPDPLEEALGEAGGLLWDVLRQTAPRYRSGWGDTERR